MAEHPHQQIYNVVRQIPYGKVATYGQVAALAGLPGHARQVGYALYRAEEAEALPWHRVINAKGEISYSFIRMGGDNLQRQLLESEGVVFNKNERIDMTTFQWQPILAEITHAQD